MLLSFVLDTDVVVAAFRSDTGASGQLLSSALEERFDLLLSVPLLFEYESVLTRPEQLAVSRLQREDIERFLKALVAVAIPVRVAFRWRPTLLDPADDMVLEAAVNGRADAIVTFNMRHFEPARRSFHCAVLSPGQALQHIRRQANETK
jgi:putative PIN family toxin of toxin-antitoxin system